MVLKKKDLLRDLKTHFRLNIYEVKIWTALLTKGVSSAGEIADISGVPRSRCYDVLESLEKKGFIMMKVGKPIEYIAIKPEVILERVKDGIKHSADSFMQHMENVRKSDEFRELELLYNTGVKHVDVSSISKSVIGATNINSKLKEMVKNARQKLIMVATAEGLERRAKLIKNSLEQLKKRNVRVRIFAPYDKNIVKRLPGVEFNDYHSESQFVSIDNSQLMFMITPDSVVQDYEVGLWINSDFFVNAVSVLFEEGMK